MKPSTLSMILLALCIIAAAIFFRWPQPPSEPLPPLIQVQPVPERPAEPAILHPLPVPEVPEPLPSLAESDPFLQELLARNIETPKLLALLIPRDFIPRLVLIIDTLPQRTIPLQHLPLKAPEGTFLTLTTADGMTIAPANAARYAPYAALAEAIPAETLASLYRRLYPLIQQAYEEMGYSRRYFNDRLVEVIDHLLATPDPAAPLLLEPRIRRVIYADPALEALSAGQKILLRMGDENRRRVVKVLRDFRTAILRQGPQ
jgi:hypothetical protein